MILLWLSGCLVVWLSGCLVAIFGAHDSRLVGVYHFHTQAIASYWILQNSTAPHATPVFINLVNDALLRWTTGTAASSITVRSEPFPFTNKQKHDISAAISFTAVLFVIIAFSFIPASFAVFVVKEREINAKHQQVHTSRMY
jgi:ATP-binding cassette subfamily A (ABC1) protein 3